jgi:hypothetical protein
MNIATKILEYYTTDDFKNNYLDVLYESFSNDENDIVNRVLSLFNTSNYETEKYLTNHKIINMDQAKKIYNFISENLESFITDFNGCYVGATSLYSVSFGEQEEQLADIYNHKTKKSYNVNYLKKIFENEGFYISESNYAYYNLDAGLHIDLLNNIEMLNEFLTTI